MSLQDDHLSNLIAKAPLEVVVAFLSLRDVLSARLISLHFAEAVSHLPAATCARYLQERLAAQTPTVHLVSNASWKRPLDLRSMESLLQRQDGGSCFHCMLRCFRVYQHLPTEVAIAFGGKYGRHCVPMQWNSEANRAEPVNYKPCERPKCPTCRLKIDMDERERPPCSIYKDYDIWLPDHSKRYEGKRRVDLSKYYPKCVPNLPHDLVCPHCTQSDERTLVLSIISYKSSTPPPQASGKPLTYTPFNDEDYIEPQVQHVYDEESSGDEQDADASDEEFTNNAANKRQREEDLVEDSFAYPHIFDEIASPKAYQPIQESEVAKYAVAIHCVSCEKFGMLAPANPCSHEHFQCRLRAKDVTFGGQNVLVGVMMVRNKCYHDNCHCSTRCMSDCRKFRHGLYGDPQTKLPFKSWCPHCHPDGNGRYCDGCAWLTSVCHHL
jgi:hypothetical protein